MATVEVKPSPSQFVLTLTEGEALAVYAALAPSSPSSRKNYIRKKLGSEFGDSIEAIDDLFKQLEAYWIKY